MKVIGIVLILILLLGAFVGYKKGAVKEFFELVGTVSIIIISYLLKGYLTAALIKYLPFWNFKGYIGLYSLNFLMYDVVSFVIIFILLYCILNILINLAGFIDKLVKYSVVYDIPSKVLGVIFGCINSLIFCFLICYVMLQVPYTQKYVRKNTFATKIVERTPVLNVVCSSGILTAEDAYNKLDSYSFKEEDIDNMNLQIATSVARYALIKKPLIQTSINNGKLNLDHVIIA